MKKLITLLLTVGFLMSVNAYADEDMSNRPDMTDMQNMQYSPANGIENVQDNLANVETSNIESLDDTPKNDDLKN